ncbi:MAG: twin-arginine translocase subunit TatC, partial [Bryobacteraceae bacterium]
MAENEAGGKMSFFEHLAELRIRLVHSAVSIGLGALVGFYVAPKILDFVARPMQAALRGAHLEDQLIFTNPTGYLNLVITLSLYLGVVLASPYVLYQIWLFIAPGLYKHERKAIAGFIFSSLVLF